MLSEEILKAISRFKNTIFFQSKEFGYYKVDKETMKGIKKIIDYIDNINNDYIKNEKITDEEKNQLDLDYVYNNFISKDKIKAFIKEEFPDDEICSYCETFDINGIDLKRKLQSLLEKEE